MLSTCSRLALCVVCVALHTKPASTPGGEPAERRPCGTEREHRDCDPDYSLAAIDTSVQHTSQVATVRTHAELLLLGASARAACARPHAECSHRHGGCSRTGGYCLRTAEGEPTPVALPGGQTYRLPAGHSGADPGLVGALLRLLCDEQGCASVNDFGAGAGQYGHELRSRDARVAWRGFDGAGDVEEFTDGLVSWVDLTVPLSLPRAAWVMYVEVGERVPASLEHMLIRNLHAHNCEGVVLSWAPFRQHGYGQISSHNRSHFVREFVGLGYVLDGTATAEFRARSVKPHLKQEVLVLRRVSPHRTEACGPDYTRVHSTTSTSGRSGSSSSDDDGRVAVSPNCSVSRAHLGASAKHHNRANLAFWLFAAALNGSVFYGLRGQPPGFFTGLNALNTTTLTVEAGRYFESAQAAKYDACAALAAVPDTARAVLWPAPYERLLRWHTEACNQAVEALRRRVAVIAAEPDFDSVDGDDSRICPVLNIHRPAWVVPVPHPSWAHPASDAEAACLLETLQTKRRVQLFAVYAHMHGTDKKKGRGPAVDDLRAALNSECRAAGYYTGSCRSLNALSPHADPEGFLSGVADAFSNAHFCLQPVGDTPMRASIFDGLAALCIPVFFADCVHPSLLFETGYSPFLPTYTRTGFGVGKWAVLLNATLVQRERGALVRALRAIDSSTRECLRRNIVRMWRRFNYHAPGANMTQMWAQEIFENLMGWQGLAQPRPATSIIFQHLPLEDCAAPGTSHVNT